MKTINNLKENNNSKLAQSKLETSDAISDINDKIKKICEGELNDDNIQELKKLLEEKIKNETRIRVIMILNEYYKIKDEIKDKDSFDEKLGNTLFNKHSDLNKAFYGRKKANLGIGLGLQDHLSIMEQDESNSLNIKRDEENIKILEIMLDEILKEEVIQEILYKYDKTSQIVQNMKRIYDGRYGELNLKFYHILEKIIVSNFPKTAREIEKREANEGIEDIYIDYGCSTDYSELLI